MSSSEQYQGLYRVMSITIVRRTLATILQDLPLDSTLPEEHIFAALFKGQVGEVIKRANDLDIWLAAHLADMMQPLGLLMDIEGFGYICLFPGNKANFFPIV